LWSVGLGGAFHSFRWTLLRRFHPRGFPSVDGSHRDTTFDRSVGVARPRARYARNPFPSGRESTPWPPPACARFLLRHPTIARRAFRLSAADFPRGDCSIPIGDRLSPRGAQGHVGQVMNSGFSPEPHAEVCMLPLLTLAQQCCLTAFHLGAWSRRTRSVPGSPTFSAFPGVSA